MLHRFCASYRRPEPAGVTVLDLIYLALTLGLFALVGLAASAISKVVDKR